ncbi:uncharacterized protein LOC115880850 isoform X2 [Sitophilus oryzae]|uniref:Uncharacterized protein LOC115880850 isoform X2 n=1 Tax=Sitophilus oryzae TaxID=7048 RepID=A0A6J2XSL6_SITOR|nr:uncharacterized protein LOC115880850 isoform X2 [Sitophilus oryzae]
MDSIPLLLENENGDKISTFLNNAFQEELQKEQFPLHIAPNIRKYNVDDDLSYEDPSKNAIQIHEDYLNESDILTTIEKTIIKDHAEFLVAKHNTEQDEFIKEMCKLKSCDIFNLDQLDRTDVMRYGLIDKSDLYPHLTRQFLDFRFNTTLHRCKNCFYRPVLTKSKKPKFIQKNDLPNNIENTLTEIDRSKQFKITPEVVVFHNYKVNKTYEQYFKITNTSNHLQSISVKTLPKLKIFTIMCDSARIAPGMSLKAIIKFRTDVYLLERDEIIFKNDKGLILKLPLICKMDPPKLYCVINRSTDYSIGLLEKNALQNKSFSVKRKNALNETIDCGPCFVTDYVLVNIFLYNGGYKAKFFLITEENWFSRKIDEESISIDGSNGILWVYPAYFEILNGETTEMNVIFQPMKCGLFSETLYLLTDKNTYQQLEIIGDGIAFNKKLISVDVPNHSKDIESKPGHRIFLGYIENTDPITMTLRLKNNSGLLLKYKFKCVEKNDDIAFDMSNWIQTNYENQVLAPYGTSEVIFQITPLKCCTGDYCNTSLRLFIKDVPITSLEENEEFVIETQNRSLRELVEHVLKVDVLCMDVEVACFIKEDKPIEDPTKDNLCVHCNLTASMCPCCTEVVPDSDIVFSDLLLDFSVLPVGVDVKKDFYIMNLGEKQLNWRIIEIQYNIDKQPYFKIIKRNHISEYSGMLLPKKKKVLSYSIIKRQPLRWFSILVLFSFDGTDNAEELRDTMTAECMCIVTYEVVKMNITVNSPQSQEPILCPLQMLYTGVPVDVDFELQNNSLVTGCFYFLKPIGSDSEKIVVKYEPQRGTLRPGKSKKITIKLTCTDIGILENIYLPYYIGQGHEHMFVRLLCVVDCIRVFFYLPNKENTEFRKILWSPRVLYEYDRTWSQYCMCENVTYEDAIKSVQLKNEEEKIKKSNETLQDLNVSRLASREKTDGAESSMDVKTPLKTLVEVDSEIFLQEYTMEVVEVQIKTPTKVTFYIENVTPVKAKYVVQSTTYNVPVTALQNVLKNIYKTTEELWTPLLEKNCIVVQPAAENGILEAHELIAIDIWIYSNTWGIYTDEIIVDISDLSLFSFSLVIEVVGCPLQVPFGIGSINKYPIVRFGSVAMHSDDIIRNVTISNISSVDVEVSWHVFFWPNKDIDSDQPAFNFLCDVNKSSENMFDFDFTEEYFGIEGCKFIEVLPTKSQVSKNSKETINILFSPKNVETEEKQLIIKGYVFGRIFVNKGDRFKSNYFFRQRNFIIVEISVRLYRPYLDFSIENDHTNLHIFANDVILQRKSDFEFKFKARNPLSCTVEGRLDVGKPFCPKKDEVDFALAPGECKNIIILCSVTYENIHTWAEKLYTKPVTPIDAIQNVDVHNFRHEVIDDGPFHFDEDNKSITIAQNLVIRYSEELNESLYRCPVA